MTSFLSDALVSTTSWQAFERLISRLLIVEGFEYVALVGRTGDGGADVLSIKDGKRWLFQVKRLAAPVSCDVVNRTVAAMRSYCADVPVIVSKSGFVKEVFDFRARLARETSGNINIQLWDRNALARRADRLPIETLTQRCPNRFRARDYQGDAIQKIVNAWLKNKSGDALVVLATGLGKTFIAAEAMRRVALLKPGLRVLVVAHTNDLVYQLERAFWPFLSSEQATAVINGVERPEWFDLRRFQAIFASRDILASAEAGGVEFPDFDVVIVDECHHLGADTYERVLNTLNIGSATGPFLLGMTATPWRPKGGGLDHRFDAPVVSIDLVAGLQRGFLGNVDYRMFTDNVDWASLRQLKGDRFTPKSINRTLFINQWDDAVVDHIRRAWEEIEGRGRGIVFCGTIDHAEKMAARINALGFSKAEPIYSHSSSGEIMSPITRNRLLWDFADGRVGLLCSVDVLNEGIDVPDVNLVVFQRVTHSRRIFLQQLGRGLRLAPGKTCVIVLDFVSDVRRFAAGLELQKAIEDNGPAPGNQVRLNIPSRVTFQRANQEDLSGANFLREWLGDLEEVEQAGEDVSVLRFPPIYKLPVNEERNT